MADGLQTRVHQALVFFKSQGWTHNQACGIVANLQAESQVDPTRAQYNGGPGYGIAQWERPRQGLFKQVYSRDIHGTSLDQQLAFVQYELTVSEYPAGEELKKTNTAGEAGASVCRSYERPADIEGQAKYRCDLAEKIAASCADFENVDSGVVTPPAPIPNTRVETVAHTGVAAGLAGSVLSDIASQFQSLTAASRIAFWAFLALAVAGGALKVFAIFKKSN